MFRRRRMMRAWELAMALIEAHRVQGELDISPWDALLMEVRRSAYRSSWVDQRLEQVVQHQRELEHESEPQDRKEADADVRRWMQQSRFERSHLTRVAKAALDAGIAAAMVQQVELEAQSMQRVLNFALDALALAEDDRITANRALREALLNESTRYQRELPAAPPNPATFVRGQVVTPGEDGVPGGDESDTETEGEGP